MSQCTRRGPKTRGQCSKFGYGEHEEHHSLETGEKWTDRDYPCLGRSIVVIESPYAGDVERNLAYLRAAMRDSLQRGEAPYASHALYTQPGVLDDSNPAERRAGIEAGFVFRHVAALTAVYQDLGATPGMVEGIRHAEKIGCLVEYRTVPGWKWEPKEEPSACASDTVAQAPTVLSAGKPPPFLEVGMTLTPHVSPWRRDRVVSIYDSGTPGDPMVDLRDSGGTLRCRLSSVIRVGWLLAEPFTVQP